MLPLGGSAGHGGLPGDPDTSRPQNMDAETDSGDESVLDAIIVKNIQTSCHTSWNYNSQSAFLVFTFGLENSFSIRLISFDIYKPELQHF